MLPREEEGAGDWGEYRRLILQELQRLHDGINEVQRQIGALQSMEIASIKAQIAVLQFKSGVWGFLAGAVPSAAAVFYVLVKS